MRWILRYKIAISLFLLLFVVETSYLVYSTGTSKKKLNIMKKVNIFCHSFQKVKPIYYIDSLRIEWNISNLYFIFLNVDYGLQIIKTQNSVSQKIWILHKINKKSDVRLLKVCSFLCSQYLVGAPFAWITASVRRGMETISLWHCSSVMKHRLLW